MAPASVSFRISRSAEDLAETIHALSHRLVTLEQRLAAMELQASRQASPEPEELARLDHVERLLQDCRHLLEIEAGPEQAAEREEHPTESPFHPEAPHSEDPAYASAA